MSELTQRINSVASLVRYFGGIVDSRSMNINLVREVITLIQSMQTPVKSRQELMEEAYVRLRGMTDVELAEFVLDGIRED